MKYQDSKKEFFKLVHAYFVNKKLKDLSEYEFINHWENVFFITFSGLLQLPKLLVDSANCYKPVL